MILRLLLRTIGRKFPSEMHQCCKFGILLRWLPCSPHENAVSTQGIAKAGFFLL